MKDISDQRVQLQNKLRSVTAEYRAAAGKFAAGEVGEALILKAKANVDAVNAQIEALDDFENERANKSASEAELKRSKENAEETNAKVAGVIEAIDRFQKLFMTAENYIDLLAEQYAELSKIQSEIPARMSRLGRRAGVKIAEVLPMPMVVSQMLGLRMGVLGLAVVGRSAPLMTGLQDRKEIERHAKEIMKKTEHAKSYVASHFVDEEENM